MPASAPRSSPTTTSSTPASCRRATWGEAEEDIRAATTGKHGLLTRSVELDADALVVRATVLTYRWIDELQQAAYKTLGSIAGRAIGYLAPEVALGGAIVSAGLIETDALDRDGVTAYLNELAENNPELMDHLSGGGGLLDGLQMRSLLTAGALASDQGAHAARGGLRAIGVDPFPTDAVSAFRDSAGSFVEAEIPEAEVDSSAGTAPRSLEELMANLLAEDRRISVQRVGAGRYIAYLPGSLTHDAGRLRLVGADPTTSISQVVRAIEAVGHRGRRPGDARRLRGRWRDRRRDRRDRPLDALRGRPGRHRRRPVRPGAADPRGHPRAVARGPRRPGRPARLARSTPRRPTGSPSSSTAAGAEGRSVYVAGARAADSAAHPELRAEIDPHAGPGLPRRLRPALRRCRGRTRRAGRGCGTRPSARSRRSGRRAPSRRCPSAGGARG